MRMTQYRLDLISEIARDNWTLDHDPDPAPNRAFYMERILANHAEVMRLKEGA